MNRLLLRYTIFLAYFATSVFIANISVAQSRTDHICRCGAEFCRLHWMVGLWHQRQSASRRYVCRAVFDGRRVRLLRPVVRRTRLAIIARMGLCDLSCGRTRSALQHDKQFYCDGNPQ